LVVSYDWFILKHELPQAFENEDIVEGMLGAFWHAVFPTIW
jgi:hypothetical protein